MEDQKIKSKMQNVLGEFQPIEIFLVDVVLVDLLSHGAEQQRLNLYLFSSLDLSLRGANRVGG